MVLTLRLVDDLREGIPLRKAARRRNVGFDRARTLISMFDAFWRNEDVSDQ